MRPLLLWTLAQLALVSIVLPATAHANSRYAALVMDADTGEVLYARHADQRRRPASLTKMMTLYMVFEAMAAGRLGLDDRITISKRAAGQAPSRLGLTAGSSLSAREAVLALVTRSANDVATAVAEHLGGTEFSFALKMTARARTLGLKHTTFRNASGLPARGQWSTARDMGALARALLRDFPNHYRYFSVREFEFEGRAHRNHNNLLGSYDGIDGIKTGYIRASGFNLVASAVREGRRLIGIVFGGRSARSRDQHMRTLLDRGFVALASRPPLTAKIHKVANATTTPGHWRVQVGAYSRFGAAERRARQAQNALPELLGPAVVTVTPLSTNGRTLYRARLESLTRSVAQNACERLQQHRFECLLLAPRAEG